MSDNKITQDQLEPNVMEELESGIGDLSTLSTENKDSLVAAVTEIYGKNVIAEAIGEPLAVTDTFAEMGSEINSLLSSFKTNMMNSGVMVEGSDKFKQLIEKIKGLTEGEGNKGIQYAEGIVTRDITHAKNFNDIDGYSSSATAYIVLPKLDFEPTILIATSNQPSGYYPVISLIAYDYNFNTLSAKSALFSGSVYGNGLSYNFKADELVFLEDAIHLPVYNGEATTFNWYAIGVGEQSSGSKGLDIISATELPESGKENQLCVITDNITNKFILSSSWDDVNSAEGSIIVKLGNSTENVITVGEGIQTIYRVDGIYQGNVENALNSYLYKNGSWDEFSEAVLYIVKDGEYVIDNKFAEKTAYVYYVNGAGVVYDIAVGIETSDYAYSTLPNMVDVTNLNSINISWIKDSVFADDEYVIYVYLCPTNKGAGTSSISSGYTYGDSFSFTTKEGSNSIDLSSYTGEYYITILHKHYNSKAYSRNTSLTITDLYFK